MKLYWVEFSAHTLRQAPLASGAVSTLAGAPDPCVIGCGCTPPGGYLEGTGADARFNQPRGLAFHAPTHSLFLLDAGNFVLRRVQ